VEITEGMARKAALQLAATLLSQAADDREGDHFQRLRQAGASAASLERLRQAMRRLAEEWRAAARRPDLHDQG
jgi:hypothetical protein